LRTAIAAAIEMVPLGGISFTWKAAFDNKPDRDRVPGSMRTVLMGRSGSKALRPTGKISDVFDFLKRRNGPTLSIAEMNRMTACGWPGKR
jgi:hypothetical protein